MSAFLRKVRGFYIWIIVAFFVGSFALYSASQEDFSDIKQAQNEKDYYRNLSQHIKDPATRELLEQIYNTSEGYLGEYQNPSLPPSDGNNLEFFNQDLSNSFYVSAVSTNGHWLSGDTTGTWTASSPVCWEIQPGRCKTIAIPKTTDGTANLYISSEEIKHKPDIRNYDDAKYMWQLVEITTGWTWDLSYVDGFSIPLAMMYRGYCVGFKPNPRNFLMKQICNDLKVTETPFRGNETDNIIKAPKHYMSREITYLDDGIKAGLEALAETKQTTQYDWTYSDFSWTPSSSGVPPSLGVLTAKADKKTTCSLGTIDPKDYVFENYLNSYNVLSTNFLEPNDCVGRFRGLLAVMMNRGVVDNPADWGLSCKGQHCPYPWKYYQDTDKNKSKYNRYAMALHKWCYNTLVYAVDHDDIYEQSSSIGIQAGTTVYIYIYPMSGAPKNPNPVTFNGQYCTHVSVPEILWKTAGALWVNGGQWVNPNITGIASPWFFGLPQTFDMGFAAAPGSDWAKHRINITLDGNGGGQVNNPQDWNNSRGIVINNYNIALPADLSPVSKSH